MLTTFADAEEALRASLRGYESRPEQRSLAARVEELLRSRPGAQPTHLLGQAGTGTGKSLAYTIPAILSGRRVIISVTTKTLQDQLAKKDMPFLEEHLGVAFSWALLKGRSNYLCVRLATSAEEDIPSLRQVLLYARENPGWDGSRDALPFQVPGHEWALMCSDGDSCREAGCKEALEEEGDEGCRAEVARRKARNSRIVIVNHALYFTDLAVRAAISREADEDGDDEGWSYPGMLGEHEFVIFDEAHELERIAGDSLGGRLVEATFRTLASEMRAWARRYLGYDLGSVEQVEKATARVAMGAVDLFDNQRTREHPNGRGLPKGTIRTATLNAHAEQLVELDSALEALGEVWDGLGVDHVDEEDLKRAKGRYQKLLSRLEHTVARLRDVYSDDDGIVRWVAEEPDRRGRYQREIRTCPLSVAPFLREHLYSKTPCALVSATLSVSDKFDFVADRVGARPFSSIDVGTPFDFQSQSRFYIATDLPDPKDARERWQAAANERILQLVRASEGRALVLFTSRAHMKDAAQQVGERLSDGYRLLVQGDDDNASLSKTFRSDVSSVLFGVASFGTGFDVQGEALSHLIIAKIPMPVPDDALYEARANKLIADARAQGVPENRAKWKGFEYGCKLASLTLQQFDGRGIRTKTDRCVTSLLDPRFETKGYGKTLLKDLPDRPRLHDVSQITDFLSAP